jgi:hypothetical protein
MILDLDVPFCIKAWVRDIVCLLMDSNIFGAFLQMKIILNSDLLHIKHWKAITSFRTITLALSIYLYLHMYLVPQILPYLS